MWIRKQDRNDYCSVINSDQLQEFWMIPVINRDIGLLCYKIEGNCKNNIIRLGTYMGKELCKRVFNVFCEALDRGDEFFKFPKDDKSYFELCRGGVHNLEKFKNGKMEW